MAEGDDVRRRVVIESPYNGSTPEITARNVDYAKAAMFDSLQRGEAPFASHLLYTQVLNDKVERDRAAGMSAGFAWGNCAEAVVVYQDRGISAGMAAGIQRALTLGIPVEYRKLNNGWGEFSE